MADDIGDEGSRTMSNESTHAVAPIDGKKVQPIGATVPQPHHERPAPFENEAGAAPAADVDEAAIAGSAAAPRTTDLAYQVDAESKRVSVHVVDRATGSVVRSFPLFMPGQAAAIDGRPGDAEAGADAEAPRGALVDAKV
jgi:hypothetical protein